MIKAMETFVSEELKRAMSEATTLSTASENYTRSLNNISALIGLAKSIPTTEADAKPKKSKAKAEPAAEETAPVADEPVEEPVAEPVAEAQSYTLEDIRKRVYEAKQSGINVKDIILKYATNLTAVDPSDYPKLVADLEAA